MGILSRTQRRFSLTFELILVMTVLLVGGLLVTGWVTSNLVHRMNVELRQDTGEFALGVLTDTEDILRQQGELSAKQVVQDKSLHMNEVLAGVERIVNLETRYAQQLGVERLPGTSYPMYANEDFLNPARRPPDFGPEPGRHRDVSLSATVFKLAPGVQRENVGATLQRYRHMGFLFQELYRVNPNVEWLYLGTADGLYLGYPADGGFDEDYDPRTRPWYTQAIEADGLTWSEPYDDVTGGKLVTCSRPVKRPGSKRVSAVVAVDVTVDELGRLANVIEAGLSGEAFILDRAGNVLSAPEDLAGIAGAQNLLIEADGELAEVVKKMVAGETGLTLVEYQGRKEYIAFAPITTTGWSLGVVFPLDTIQALAIRHQQEASARIKAAHAQTEDRLKSLRAQLWATGAVLIIILILLFTGGAYTRLTRPILDVIRDLSIIRRGDLDHRVDVSGAQEFRNLSAAINQMTAHLKKSRLAIEDYSHTLERKVAERTKELAASNQELEETVQRLKQTQSMLVHSEKMASLGQLVAGIAHEINNPVNFIANSVGPCREALLELDEKVTAEQASNGVDPELIELVGHIRKALDLIETGASRTKQIVLNLRNFSRLDEADIKLANIHEGIDGSLSLLGYLIKDRIQIVRDYGDIGAVECNPGQLNQVFMNILSNAVQAIEGDGEIRIQTELVDDDVVIRIADSGSGIEPDDLGKIFDPFFTTKAVGEGTGLGLSITHGIIEKHGGTISVSSAVGEGTEFTIRIPMVATVERRLGG